MSKVRESALIPARTPPSATGSFALRLRPPTYGIAVADAANDAYEREADRVASQVMAHSNAMPQPRAPTSPPTSGGQGQPLPPSLCSFYESRFGHDFSQVRLHTGGGAASAARSINARAFTRGRDVVLGAGEYRPDSVAGRHLLAHELTHVIQQGGARSRGGAGPSTTPAPAGIVQRVTNKGEAGAFRVVVGDDKITLIDKANQKRGFIDYFIRDGTFYLKTIDTKSGKGPKGAGAMLVYMVAMTSLGRHFERIMVTNATPEETGFYLHMGFGPDPAFLQRLQETGMPSSDIERIKNTTLSADVNTLLDQAGASVIKNWSDPSWEKGGLYAGRHPEHGDMFHIPL
jgi:hypothetical protein